MVIRKLVLSVPHVIPENGDNETHPWDRIAYKVGKRTEDILRNNDIQVKLVRPTDGREQIDQNYSKVCLRPRLPVRIVG